MQTALLFGSVWILCVSAVADLGLVLTALPQQPQFGVLRPWLNHSTLNSPESIAPLIEQYRTRELFAAGTDRRIGVYDQLIESALAQSVWQMLRQIKYSLADADTAETNHIPHWIHEFGPNQTDSLSNGFIRALAAVGFAHAGVPKAKLKRAHANLQQHGDSLHVHTDLDGGFTLLYYANSNEWSAKCHGETLFFDDARDALFAVSPREGRIVVFDADIPHRTGLPDSAPPNQLAS